MSLKILILSALCAALFSTYFPAAVSQHLSNKGYVGCYKDKENRAFERGSGYVNNIDHCINKCEEKKYQYAGLESIYGKIECWCGNKFDKHGKSNSCNKPCKNGGGMCGGKWALSVYKTLAILYLPNRGYVGCYKDAKDRAFEHFSGYVKYIDHCINNCKKKKYKYAGLQWSVECWCGNKFDKYGESYSCYKRCKSRGGMCGGNLALSVYKTHGVRISGKGKGYLKYKGYVGCFNDHSVRELPYDAGDVYDIDGCIEKCNRDNFMYAGIQYKSECFCGDDVGFYGQTDSCTKNCKRGGGKCGGSWANSVYKTNAKRYPGYIGCFHDKKDRDLSVDPGSLYKNFLEVCIIWCRRKGLKYAGLQYHRQCRCGNHYGRYGKAERCDTPCAIGPGMCGGAWKNSIYHTG